MGSGGQTTAAESSLGLANRRERYALEMTTKFLLTAVCFQYCTVVQRVHKNMLINQYHARKRQNTSSSGISSYMEVEPVDLYFKLKAVLFWYYRCHTLKQLDNNGTGNLSMCTSS